MNGWSWNCVNLPHLPAVSVCFHPPFSLLVRPRSGDWHQAESSHLVPVNASESWNPHWSFATFQNSRDLRLLCVSNRKPCISKNDAPEHGRQSPGSFWLKARATKPLRAKSTLALECWIHAENENRSNVARKKDTDCVRRRRVAHGYS